MSDKDVEYARELVDSKANSWKTQSFWAFTNEYLRAYLKDFQIEGANVLAPLASGDHLFNILLQNPEKVTTYDINPITYYWAELKKAAIKTMTLDDFKAFFVKLFDPKRGKPFISGGDLGRLCGEMEAQSGEFWGEIGVLDGQNCMRLFHEFTSIHNEGLETLNDKNDYFEPTKYKTLQHKLENFDIPFLHEDLLNLPNVVTKKFDTILTSNIGDYVGPERYENFVKNDIGKMLKAGGRAQIAYGYDYNSAEWAPGVRKLMQIGGVKMHRHPQMYTQRTNCGDLTCDVRPYILSYDKLQETI